MIKQKGAASPSSATGDLRFFKERGFELVTTQLTEQAPFQQSIFAVLKERLDCEDVYAKALTNWFHKWEPVFSSTPFFLNATCSTTFATVA